MLPSESTHAKVQLRPGTTAPDQPEGVATEQPQNLPFLTNLKMGLFNFGSALADILGSGVWNRIMIADLNYPATPVSLLLGLNYFLAPLVVWVGQKSDYTNWRGYRRLPWIWSGRALIAIGFLLLAFATVELAESGSNIWWGGIAFALSLTGIGAVLSGSTYTTLIYDRAPPHQRGRAVGLAWTMLLFGFAFSGVLFARLLPDYSPEGVITLFVTTVAIISALWVFSILGEERPLPPEARPPRKSARNTPFMQDFRAVWSQPTTRLFFLYIGLSFTAAFAQDQILEPFGGQVFAMPAGETSRFAAFWGTTALLGSLFALYAHRRMSHLTYARINRYGIWSLITTFLLLALAAFSNLEALIRPTLLLFGLGLGLWNIGTWGLMVSVSSAEKAGTYFGLWTMASLIFRGGGSVVGAIFRDVAILTTGSESFSYGAVFAIEALVMLAAFLVIQRIHFSPQTDADGKQILVAVGAEG
ncbi:MAG: BCD family MFS transporter [Chloroflexi bacterium]|nr:BCD family MFS transporter [Chloroflexota bacterium]